ncbi:MAG TPA: hypothetical protein VJS92_07940 [Candidatus Polarisedimenticolaceae bacterium]|nr:hypothetical protein [Candidatus Polarisedimenticolaceae bacterium]
MFSTRKLAHVVVPVLAALALQALAAGAPPKPRGKSTGKPTAKVVVPVTISITSLMRRGNLVVSLDNVPVFNEEFRKPIYLISQTTTWGDPLQVAAGKHRLTAKVVGARGKTYVSETYNLEVSPTKGMDLRFRTKGDRLTVEGASGS